MFPGGKWLRSKSKSEESSIYQILEGQYQWFINIVSYLHFVTGETVSTAESQRDEVHDAKSMKTKEQSVVI